MKILIAALLSAAMIWLAPAETTQINKQVGKAPRVHKPIPAQIITPQPEQTVEPVAAPVPQVQGCEAYRSLIDQYDWNHQVAFAVMKAENTGCNPAEDNAGLNNDGSVDYGLFQVNSVHAAMVDGNLEALRDPATNIAVAYRVYAGSGWNAWSTFKNGRYLAYL